MLVLLPIFGNGCAQRAASLEPLLPADQLVIRGNSAAVPPKRHITIATYNVHWLTERDKIREDLAALDDVEVWCLQEMRFDEHAFDGNGAGAVSSLEKVLPRGPWYAAVIRANRLAEIGSNDWEAQVIAARHPMDDIRVWGLDATGSKRRAALTAKLTVGAQSLLVVNTDHEPSFFARRDGNNRQSAELNARLALAGEPFVLLAGDFNCAGRLLGGFGNSAHIRRLDRLLASTNMAPVDLSDATFQAWPWSLRLDRIYLRGLQPIDAHVDDRCSGSDHRAVWCTVQFPEP